MLGVVGWGARGRRDIGITLYQRMAAGRRWSGGERTVEIHLGVIYHPNQHVLGYRWMAIDAVIKHQHDKNGLQISSIFPLFLVFPI